MGVTPSNQWTHGMSEEEKRRMRNQSAVGGGPPVFEETAAGGIRRVGYDGDATSGCTTFTLSRIAIDAQLKTIFAVLLALETETAGLHTEMLGPRDAPSCEFAASGGTGWMGSLHASLDAITARLLTIQVTVRAVRKACAPAGSDQ